MSEPQPGVVEIASATPIGSVAENRPGLEPVRGNGEGVSMKRTAVLVPCYNEEVTVAKVVTDFRAALPDADLYELGEWGLRRADYDDLDLVRAWRSFLEAPERFPSVLVPP